MRRKLFFRWVLAVLSIGIIFVAGCGKKGDPIPPKAALLPSEINRPVIPEGVIGNMVLVLEVGDNR